MKYTKKTPRLNVRFFDGETEEYLFGIDNVNWMEVGQYLTDQYVTQIVTNTLGDEAPSKIEVIIDAEFFGMK